MPPFVAFSIEARMEARWAGVYLLRLFSTGGVAAGAAFEAALAAFSGLDAALVVLAAGAAAAFAGLGSAFLRGARVFFVMPTGSAVLTSTGVSFTAAMVSSAMLCFSRSMFGNSFRRQKYRSMVDVTIRPCTSCVQDEIDLLSGHIDQVGDSVEC